MSTPDHTRRDRWGRRHRRELGDRFPRAAAWTSCQRSGAGCGRGTPQDGCGMACDGADRPVVRRVEGASVRLPHRKMRSPTRVRARKRPRTARHQADLFRVNQAAPPDIPFATSASTIMISEFQDACIRHPGARRARPSFESAHLIPLVEVGGGEQTSPDAIERAMNFYRAMGKHPIHLRREIMGHVANRLQAALWQEAFNLINAGVASVADVDAAIAQGRGALVSARAVPQPPSVGRRGRRRCVFGKPLWQATRGMWRDLGSVTVDADSERA